MNFNHLEYAVAVAKYGSISKAAQNIFLSQPYLSSMIKGLEDELGYKIFARTAAGITLTQEGEQFMKSAQLILLELKKIRELGRSSEEKPLSVSAYYSSFIMDRFLQFRAASSMKLPDKIKEMGNEEVLRSVLSGESSLGIVFYAKEKDAEYQALAREFGLQLKELLKPMPLYATMSPSHPLAGKSQVSLNELGQYPYVSYDDASSMRYLELLKISDHPQLLKVSDRGSFYDALNSGEYLCIMAYRKRPEHGRLVTVPLEEKTLFLLSGYVTGKTYRLTKREREFLAVLQKNNA